MRRLLPLGLAATVLLVAGCAEPSYPTHTPEVPQTPAPSLAPPSLAPPPLPPEAPPSQPIAPTGPGVAPGPNPAPPRSPIPRPQASAQDSCGANRMQGMIGRSRSLIPVPVDPDRQRVACTTCKLPDDVDPGRLNFLFNAHTGLIEQVRCG